MLYIFILSSRSKVCQKVPNSTPFKTIIELVTLDMILSLSFKVKYSLIMKTSHVISLEEVKDLDCFSIYTVTLKPQSRWKTTFTANAKKTNGQL